VAREAVDRLLTTIHSPGLDQALVASACRQLDAGTASGGEVLVESAAPLDEPARIALQNAAGIRGSTIAFRVVPDLGAGVRVTTPAGLIDASSSGIAAFAERALAERLGGPQEPEG